MVGCEASLEWLTFELPKNAESWKSRYTQNMDGFGLDLTCAPLTGNTQEEAGRTCVLSKQKEWSLFIYDYKKKCLCSLTLPHLRTLQYAPRIEAVTFFTSGTVISRLS